MSKRRRNLPSGSASGANKKLECSKVYKRRKKEEQHENRDILSNLPDHILHHIFSFVHMKQSIQTCMLSRRWRYFWVSLPTLKFSYMYGKDCRRNTRRNAFMAFVDWVLMFRGNSNIHEFKIVTDNDYINVTDRLNTWILASVIRNVQQLTLDTHFPEKFHLHQCLQLPNLCLKSVKFEDEYSTNQLFSNCPILESLTINFCEFPHISVNISSPLLRHLRLSKCRTKTNALDLGPVETNFQLCAPNLISFHWSNDMSQHCAPKNLSSLVSAYITVYGDSKLSKERKTVYAPFMVDILRGLHNVEYLTLSPLFLEVDSGAPDLLDVQSTQFCNLRCLKMNTLLSKDCIYSIAYLLKISPKIDTLSFKVSYSSDKMHPYWNPDEITSNSAERGDYWKAGLSLECLLNHVKHFELRNVEGRINELEFIEILLKNAMLLKKLLIIFKENYSYGKKKELEEERRAKFREKVLSFPRASSRVVIMFNMFNSPVPF